jgi:DNA polymerase-3 subunit delta'
MSRIVGNRDICEKLCRNVLEGKLSHAFILEGAKGSGKHTIATNLAAALACAQKERSVRVPCCECPDCKKVLEGKSPDVITVGTGDKASFGVDTIRFLREDVRVVPNDLDFKIYIIEDADKMTVQAQNAFLLTLEEPPSFVVFVLLCENADLLLETIRSRAPVLRTQAIDNEDIDEFLCRTDRRAAQMKLSSPSEYAELIISAKHGIGVALDYLEPKKFAPVMEMRALITELCDVATSMPSARAALPLILRFSQKRDILSTQLELLSEAVTDLLVIKKSDSAPLAFFADRNMATELCDRASISFLYRLSESVLTARDSIACNANVRLTLIKLFTDAQII